MRLSLSFSRYSESFVENRPFLPTPHAIGAPVEGAAVEFCGHLWLEKSACDGWTGNKNVTVHATS